MGWSGCSLYNGDDTQTRHYDFIKLAGIERDEDKIFEFLKPRKTKLPEDKKHLLTKNIKKILAKMPNGPPYANDFYSEDKAFDWHMLLSLFVDNNLKAPKIVYNNGIEATKYLSTFHAAEFNNPAARRRVLKNFINRAEKNQNGR